MSDVEIVEDQGLESGDVKPDVPARVISTVLGCMGFFTALLVGLVAGNPGITIVSRAILAMLICVVVGRILGTIGEICVREFLTKYKEDRPTPQLPEQLKRLYKAREDDRELRNKMKKAV
jgi:uncharacterized membrane protein